MTTKTIKLIAFIVLLVHGIGHFQGVAAGFGLKINKAQPAMSWLLKRQSAAFSRGLCLILFLLTGLMGIATALSFRELILPLGWWPSMALVTAFLSTICLVLFPHGFAMFFNKAGAIAVNLIIYYSILMGRHWPGALFED